MKKSIFLTLYTLFAFSNPHIELKKTESSLVFCKQKIKFYENWLVNLKSTQDVLSLHKNALQVYKCRDTPFFFKTLEKSKLLKCFKELNKLGELISYLEQKKVLARPPHEILDFFYNNDLINLFLERKYEDIATTLKKMPVGYEVEFINSFSSTTGTEKKGFYRGRFSSGEKIYYFQHDPERTSELLLIEQFKDSPQKNSNFYELNLTSENSKNKLQVFSTRECIACHVNFGPLKLHEPNSKNMTLFGEDLLRGNKKYDKQYEKYISNDTIRDGNKKIQSHIPHLVGENTEQITDEELSLCSNQVTNKNSLLKIRKAMNCTRCHDGTNTFSIPNIKDAVDLTHFKSIILKGEMPPHANKKTSKHFLNPQERLAVFNCLVLDYYRSFLNPYVEQNEDKEKFKTFLQTNPSLLKNFYEGCI